MAQARRDASPLLELGLNHEQQHQELILTDLKHLLSRNPLQPAYHRQWPLTQIRPEPPRWIGFEGGLREIGHGGRRASASTTRRRATASGSSRSRSRRVR